MAVNSRAKGANGERELAKLFSKWWGTPNAFGRTPGSGSFATRLRKFGKQEDDFRGDLFGPQTCRLHVEAKRGEAWDLEGVLCGTGRTLFDGWWDQAKTDCPPDKTPMLVFRRNRREWLVCLDTALDFYVSSLTELSDDPAKFVAVIGPAPGRVIFRLDDFFKVASPAYFGKEE